MTPIGKVYGVDPGTTTGLACVKFHPTLHSTPERPMFQRKPQVSWVNDCKHPFNSLEDMLRSAHPDSIIAVEAPPTHGRNAGGAHVEAVHHLVNKYDRGNVVWIAPGQWKGVPQAEKVVKEFNLPSSLHARDALGLAVAIGWRTFINHLPLRSPEWPGQ